ncbi:asparagine synthase [Halobiforma lacisalsi AJ5]|uniref:Asparagine synthase n=1 Tax=Natronobacterium lacisalsi AJ5 TaxID=358396 RepID=M0L638_NATLA|nr:asparagine synthase-related protein [Halobiforma lacisalsi]APW98017.1 asparagine synthase [Halobiforma lacisalsi AJ5]EMA28573.1 asparagine synthase [Halobiforma lacisalsi AJ5]
METALRSADWTRVDGVAVRGRAFDGDAVLGGPDLAERFLDPLADDGRGASDGSRLEAVAATAADIEGFYAVVAVRDDATFLVADGARSIPLYYDGEGTIVSDRGRLVRDRLEAETDPVTESEFLLTRYVTGPETVWRGVYSTQAGEVVRIRDGRITRRTDSEYWPAGAANRDASESRFGRDEHLRRLESALETALDRLERVAGDRPIVLPLSGGHDSRLLTAALAERGREVIGYTFGRSGHPDVEVSREVADRLGIEWAHVPYDESTWREWYHGPAGERYRERAFGGDALPFLAEWPALRTLVDEGRLPADGLYCPGHTVATPSERVPTFVGEDEKPAAGTVGCGSSADGNDAIEPSLEALIDYVLETHYALWEWDDDRFHEAARERIRRGLLGDHEAEAVADPGTAAAAYERWEWRGRMSTFTNGDCRAYEEAGVDWWLPLWDPAYVRAWERVPLGLRREKELHAELARRYYARAAEVSRERAAVTDRTLAPVDRCLNLIRHTPARQFTERDGDWEPPFLVPRTGWGEPGNHPLAWYGAVEDRILERAPDDRTLYALRTLAATGRLEFADPNAAVPETARIALPTIDDSDRHSAEDGR